jgi:hypothetical protein
LLIYHYYYHLLFVMNIGRILLHLQTAYNYDMGKCLYTLVKIIYE